MTEPLLASLRHPGMSFALGVGAGLALGAAMSALVSERPRFTALAGKEHPKSSPPPSHEFYVGIDVGGTTIGVGVVRGDGKMIASAEEHIPEGAESRSADCVSDLIAGLVRSALSSVVQDCAQDSGGTGMTPSDIVRFGIGAPGILDFDNGVVIYVSVKKHFCKLIDDLNWPFRRLFFP